jgi:cell pole-organizing protein PopZ
MPENAKPPPEPSMEEIIASISRIITEDKKPTEPLRPIPGPIPGEKSEILELTEVVDEDGSVRRITPLPDNPPSPPPELKGAVDPPIGDAAARSEPAVSHTDAEVEPTLETGRERILSSATSGAAAAAFAQLGALPRERRREGELALGGADRTLEDVVRDLLRPLLQTWLDEHLPTLVERLVREELARVVGEAGLR